MADQNSLKFAWWNTSLSPTISPNRASESELATADAVIKRLLEDQQVDFLGLCEVSARDCRRFRELFGEEFEVVSCLANEGRAVFDLAAIIRRERIGCVNSTAIFRKRGNRTFKLAYRLEVEVEAVEEKSTIVVLLSHWPSRLSDGQDKSKRIKCGEFLRDEVDRHLEERFATDVILMGDYNDEPFDVSLSEHLESTRDYLLVARQPHLLYNPSWYHIGYKMRFRGMENIELTNVGGSVSARADNHTRWKTFDQILVSSSFLVGGDWRLDEEQSGVITDSELVAIVGRNDSHFDHLPILLSVRSLQ